MAIDTQSLQAAACLPQVFYDATADDVSNVKGFEDIVPALLNISTPPITPESSNTRQLQTELKIQLVNENDRAKKLSVVFRVLKKDTDQYRLFFIGNADTKPSVERLAASVTQAFNQWQTLAAAKAQFKALPKENRGEFSLLYDANSKMLIGFSQLLKLMSDNPDLKAVSVTISNSLGERAEHLFYQITEKEKNVLTLVPFAFKAGNLQEQSYAVHQLIRGSFDALQKKLLQTSFKQKMYDDKHKLNDKFELLAFVSHKLGKCYFYQVPTSSLAHAPQLNSRNSEAEFPYEMTYEQALAHAKEYKSFVANRIQVAAGNNLSTVADFAKDAFIYLRNGGARPTVDSRRTTPSNIDCELDKSLNISQLKHVIISTHVQVDENQLADYLSEAHAEFSAFPAYIKQQLLLIPIALKRDSLDSKHAVFCIISKQGAILVDSRKTFSSYPENIRAMRTEWQNDLDWEQCTKYVAYSIEKLATYADEYPIDWKSINLDKQQYLLKLIVDCQILQPSEKKLASMFEDVPMSLAENDDAEFEEVEVEPNADNLT
ncbi:hypothetical protein D5018_06715 [Parashewanella curva]|uniref:Uncharacterized protein n=1 Tax=Parashewanella curva TaxID=2338552 RepID=A0A3L8Q0D2_9GAMM|nr:hypothetical protein [Parashewanella curva]RLV60479.1 hypothetical protein D5018_06715 [Parashewanella curva]